jgi:DNA-binding winged helix-turn-helix (wHTH) protein
MVSERGPHGLAVWRLRLDPERRQLFRRDTPLPLEPKAYELLTPLLARCPRALSKAQIHEVLWPGTFVSESALAGLVADLRAVLHDDARRPRLIRTVHGFGYAFCGEAREDGQSAAPAGPGLRLVLLLSSGAERSFDRPLAALTAALEEPAGGAMHVGEFTPGSRPPMLLQHLALLSAVRYWGWERDVTDDLLREDIALCVEGRPERRLGNALHLAGAAANVEGAPGRQGRAAPPTAHQARVDGGGRSSGRGAGNDALEFPLGRLLYEAGLRYLGGNLRVSPRGDRVAFIEHAADGNFDAFTPSPGHVVVIDRQARKLVSSEWPSIGGLAWSPDGNEVWFTATKTSFASAIYALSLAGRERLVAEMGETIYLHDISRDGRVLMAQGRFNAEARGRMAPDAVEHDYTWLDGTTEPRFSPDGRSFIFNEVLEGGGLVRRAYLRRSGGMVIPAPATATRLGTVPRGRRAPPETAPAGTPVPGCGSTACAPRPARPRSRG